MIVTIDGQTVRRSAKNAIGLIDDTQAEQYPVDDAVCGSSIQRQITTATIGGVAHGTKQRKTRDRCDPQAFQGGGIEQQGDAEAHEQAQGHGHRGQPDHRVEQQVAEVAGSQEFAVVIEADPVAAALHAKQRQVGEAHARFLQIG